MHTFHSTLTWHKTTSSETGKRIYTKSHTVQADDKPEMSVSAAKVFKGDPTLYNPEDLLLNSLMSCHMMSYLYVCEREGVELLSYTDTATAILETYADGSGKIVEVTLRPKVKLAAENQAKLAVDLHHKAHQLCFIANSVSFKIKIEPQVMHLQ